MKGNTMQNSHQRPDNARSYGDLYKLPVIVDPYDVKSLFHFMEVELKFYNEIVDKFGAQLQRNHTLFLEFEEEHIMLFGVLCKIPYDIYELKIKNLPDYLHEYAETIAKMSRQARFLFVDAIKQSKLHSNTRYRMGVSILRFYIEQAIIKERNSFVNTDGDMVLKTIYNNLQNFQIFNKKHLQVDRKQCKIVKDIQNGRTIIYTPYSKKPVIVNDTRVGFGNWNLMILKQEDKISTLNGQWIADFKKVRNDVYMIKQVDRLGKSSIFETTKQKI